MWILTNRHCQPIGPRLWRTPPVYPTMICPPWQMTATSLLSTPRPCRRRRRQCPPDLRSRHSDGPAPSDAQVLHSGRQHLPGHQVCTVPWRSWAWQDLSLVRYQSLICPTRLCLAPPLQWSGKALHDPVLPRQGSLHCHFPYTVQLVHYHRRQVWTVV